MTTTGVLPSFPAILRTTPGTRTSTMATRTTTIRTTIFGLGAFGVLNKAKSQSVWALTGPHHFIGISYGRKRA
ncbi:hypothetical protein SC979_08920 [Legionella pneumophila serogroup 1]